MENMKLTVTAKRKIFKYEEGADPTRDEPYAVEEQDVVLTGNDALEALEQMGVSKEGALEIAKGADTNGTI